MELQLFLVETLYSSRGSFSGKACAAGLYSTSLSPIILTVFLLVGRQPLN